MELTEWAALLGNFGEFVGAFAVVATLAYLAVQVGHSKKALDAHTTSLDESRRAAADTNRIARASGVCEWLLAVATNDDLRRSFDAVSGLALAHETTADEFDVDHDDASRSHYAIVYYFWLHWGQFASSTGEADIAELRHLIEVWYRTPYTRYQWNNSHIAKPLIDQRFIDFVDEILEEDPS